MFQNSKRLFQTVIPILLCFLLILVPGCSKKNEPEEPHESEYVFNQDEKLSDSELMDIMKKIGNEKSLHPFDEEHWSRKIMGIGLNSKEHCLDVTVIDCKDKIFQKVLDNLKEYPVHIFVTDYFVIKDNRIVEEHKYIRKEDGSVEEYHYRRNEAEEATGTSATYRMNI